MPKDSYNNVSTNFEIEYQLQDVTDALVLAVNETKLIPHKKNRLDSLQAIKGSILAVEAGWEALRWPTTYLPEKAEETP